MTICLCDFYRNTTLSVDDTETLRQPEHSSGRRGEAYSTPQRSLADGEEIY